MSSLTIAMSDCERFHVITGGPGSGKTSLIDALARAGHAHTVEAGRAIIQDQRAIDGPALPWRDPLAFAELMLSQQHPIPVFSPPVRTALIRSCR